MDKIIKVLKQNKLKESMLSQEIQTSIENLENLIVKHNAEVDELDNSEEVTEEQENHIEQQSQLIDSTEASIVSAIETFLEAKADAEAKAKEEAEQKAKDEADKKAKEDADSKAKADSEAKEEADRKAKEELNKPKPKEKKSGLGMFLLGAVVLIATAGVVNVMNKK
jgi:membrane protein involved in colicin uptake